MMYIDEDVSVQIYRYRRPLIGTEVHWYREDHSVYEYFYLNKSLESILIKAQMF